jgi:hypothetical protein
MLNKMVDSDNVRDVVALVMRVKFVMVDLEAQVEMICSLTDNSNVSNTMDLENILDNME